MSEIVPSFTFENIRGYYDILFAFYNELNINASPGSTMAMNHGVSESMAWDEVAIYEF